MKISNNVEASRLEMMLEDGSIAFVDYLMQDGHIVYTHTDVLEAHQGKGLDSQLAHEAMEYAKSNGLRVIVECPVIARYLSKHPEYRTITYQVIE